MTSKSEVLTKFFSVLEDYDRKCILASSSPEDLLRSCAKLTLRYDFDIPESDLYGLYGELADAFGLEPPDFFDFISPTVGDLVNFILGKVDIT